MQTTQSIGVIGLGTIATALVEGIAGDGHNITVSTRGTANSSRLAKRFGNVTVAENQAVVDARDILFLGLTGDIASDALGQLRFREGQQVISLMADLGFAPTADLVAPATMNARMIPFPSIASGNSPILTLGDRSLIGALFGDHNTIFPLDSEEELEVYLCAQAVLSPAVSMVKHAADWLKEQGASHPEAAEAFLRHLVGTSLLESPCAELLKNLDTPGGYNRRLREHMAEAGLQRDLQGGLDRLIR